MGEGPGGKNSGATKGMFEGKHKSEIPESQSETKSSGGSEVDSGEDVVNSEANSVSDDDIPNIASPLEPDHNPEILLVEGTHTLPPSSSLGSKQPQSYPAAAPKIRRRSSRDKFTAKERVVAGPSSAGAAATTGKGTSSTTRTSRPSTNSTRTAKVQPQSSPPQLSGGGSTPQQ